VKKRRRGEEKDSGAALILAVGFVVAIGAISGGLASLATSGLNNRTTIETARDREFAADAVIENAITQVRLLSCASSSAVPILETLNLVPIRVDWVNACGSTLGSDGVSVVQRNVIFAACVDTGSACNDADVTVANDVIIRAQVNFEPASGTVVKTYVQSWNVKR
jgi:hypothetical protein